MTEKAKLSFPGLIIIFALFLQLYLFFFVGDASSFFYKYWELALRLRRIAAPPIGIFYSSPFYISWLAVGQETGLKHLDLQILQAILGAINCWLIYRAGIFFFNRAVARLAAIAAVVYLPFILYNLSLLPSVWVITFNLLALISLAGYLQGKKSSWLVLSGLAVGFSIITRPNFALFLILLILFFVFLPPKPDYKRNATVLSKLKRVGIVLIPALLVILPVARFNYSHSGELVPVSASEGWVFYCSNNPRVKGFDFSPPPEFDLRLGYYYSLPGIKLNYVEHLLSLELAREKTGRKLRPSEASRYWRNRGMDFIRGNPRLYLALLGKKIMAAINSYEAHDVPEVLERNDRLKSLPLLTAGIIFPLAFLGLIITRPRSAVILYLYLSAYLVSFLIMYVTPRFRLPVVPVLLLFAAAALLRLIEQLRQKQWKTFTRNMIVLLPLFVLVNLRPPDIRRDRNISRPAFLYEWRGLTRMKEREWEKAAEAFEKALRLNPDSLRARSNLKLLKQKLANGD